MILCKLVIVTCVKISSNLKSVALFGYSSIRNKGPLKNVNEDLQKLCSEINNLD